MNKYIKSILALTAICAVVAVLLACANYITKPIIDKNNAAAANEALFVVMPSGGDFEAVELAGFELPKSVTEAYRASNGGYVVKLNVSGFNPDMVIMCGVDANGTVTGATCLSSGETLGYEKSYGEKVLGASIDTVDALDTVGGATKTTAAYKGAVKDALNTAIILGGGSVDIRTEEEIFAENLAAALPAANGEFNYEFITEELENVSAIYKAVNESGYVYVIGEYFIGVSSDGTVLSGEDEAARAKAYAAAKIMLASKSEDIDLTAYESIPSSVLSAKLTESGNYIIEARASGYGITGDKYTASGEYIYIKLSVTAGGKIIACQTLSQKETDGYGAACALPEFYTQFNGKTIENYAEIDGIGGATKTTNGYKSAVLRVLETVNILKGELQNEEAE